MNAEFLSSGYAPLISVIMPFYNGEKFLAAAIDSVLAQSYRQWELLLIDDGSVDGGTAIAQDYAQRFPDQVRYFDHPEHRNRGKSTSRNLGIEQALGKYMTFLDADDIFLPDKLRLQVEIMETQPAIGMVYGRTLYWYDWEEKGKRRKRDHMGKLGLHPDQLIHPPGMATYFLINPGRVPCICSLLARADLMREIGGYDESIQHLYEDQVLIFKLCLKAPVYIINDCGEKYRQHPHSSTNIAIREGAYHPMKLNPTRHIFLNWLKDYIEREGTSDESLQAALQRALWPYGHPCFYRIIAPFHYTLKCIADKLSWKD
jgi:glycosyltransferase involved in cell wall biosynthesis